MDIWEPIQDFPQYVVSPDGLIMNKDRHTPKATRLNNQGDLIVDLSRDDKKHTRKVSLLVAQAYLGEPPENYNSVVHLNGDRSDCRAINLAWRPRWFVVEYNRMFLSEPLNCSVKIKQTGEIFGTLREACMKYGMIESRAYMAAHNGNPVFPHGYQLEIL
ncbi:HNH endonuclease [Gordonia phage Crocheter]|uniref:HNH endonuclease n=1 Tax=Gordonia phage Crocheter TaxID=2656532 RepID=A0A649VEQ1_9CAUD|nr:HNH endonuclease [Gordonia phage Crocheter]QGJ90432.1 HNH endonuclease [Gordonia phage Crocheter]